MSGSAVLYSEAEIRARVEAMAHAIAAAPRRPEILVPVLVGAFVFAADLSRALSREGLDLPVEFLWLASYRDGRAGGEVAVRAGAGEAVHGKSVLLVDGVLDRGRTLMTARDLLVQAGASTITTAVVVDKRHAAALLRADFACFTDVADFIAGYGMDDAGRARGLPYIAKLD